MILLGNFISDIYTSFWTIKSSLDLWAKEHSELNVGFTIEHRSRGPLCAQQDTRKGLAGLAEGGHSPTHTPPHRSLVVVDGALSWELAS